MVSKYLCVLFFLSISCTSQINQNINCLDSIGFDKTSWKKDSFGCDFYRQRNFSKILECSKALLNSKLSLIIWYFGEPNFVDSIDNKAYRVYYLVEPNIFCKSNIPKNLVNRQDVESRVIYMFFSKDQELTKVGTAVP